MSCELSWADFLDDMLARKATRGRPYQLEAETVVTISNRKFLEALVGEDWRRVPIQSFGPEAGPNGDWRSFAAGGVIDCLNPLNSNYFCTGLFGQPEASGFIRRSKERLERQFILPVDDVGTKIVKAELLRVMPPPTYVLETSPGNFHVSFGLTNGTDARVLTALIDAIIGRENVNPSLRDPGMVGVTRVMRLPVGANNKPEVAAANGGKPWPHVLHVWEPQRTYTVEEMAGWLDVDISEALTRYKSGGRSRRATTVETGLDPLMRLFDQKGMLINATPNDNGFVTVRCPWAHEHTAPGDEAGYRPGSGGFKCHHGHCEGRGMNELRAWVEEAFTRVERAAALAETFGPVDWGDPVLKREIERAEARHKVKVAQMRAAEKRARSAVAEAPGGAKEEGDGAPADIALVDPAIVTEDWLALRFVERFGERIRYIPQWGRWRVFDGAKWSDDNRLTTFDMARRICRAVADRLETARDRHRLGSAKTRAAVVSLAQSDPRVVATIDQWDTDIMALNTPAGVVDLTSGEIRKQRADDYLSKITAARPEGSCPQFLKFLDRVTGGDKEFVAYLRRVFGYCLTGSTNEDALFFLYGTGANGKSTLLRVVKAVLNDYAISSPSSVFTAARFDSHPTEIARLHGKRLVVSSEIEPGQKWAESRIKQLTGGDDVSARMMRQDFFDFTPQLKLLIAGNHKPGLSDVSEAFRRRFHLLPFVVTIPESERDKDLEEKLLAEGSGILRWMIEGCADWQAIGLKPPSVVATATGEYLQSQDRVAQWIDAECDAKRGAEELLVSVARTQYNAWAAGGEVEQLNRDQFTERMARLGHQKRKARAGYVFPNLVLRAPFATYAGGGTPH